MSIKAFLLEREPDPANLDSKTIELPDMVGNVIQEGALAYARAHGRDPLHVHLPNGVPPYVANCKDGSVIFTLATVDGEEHEHGFLAIVLVPGRHLTDDEQLESSMLELVKASGPFSRFIMPVLVTRLLHSQEEEEADLIKQHAIGQA